VDGTCAGASNPRHGVDIRFATPRAKTENSLFVAGPSGCDMGACVNCPPDGPAVRRNCSTLAA